MRAIILIVRLADLALQASSNLSTDTNTVPNLNCRHFVAHLDCLANDLVTDTEGKRDISPASGYAVDITAANTTAVDLDIDVTIFEWLGFELERTCQYVCCPEPKHTRSVLLLAS